MEVEHFIFHDKTREEALAELTSQTESGLSRSEVLQRRERYGENKLREKKKKTMLGRFLEQFKDVMIIILLAAAVVSFALVIYEQNWADLFEPLLILLIVILRFQHNFVISCGIPL